MIGRLSMVLVVVAAIVAGGDALACRCTGPSPGPAAAAKADVALLGKVVDITYGNVRTPHRQTAVVLEVERAYKGDVSGRVTVLLGETSCGLSGLAIGETWALFAKTNADGALETRQCNGSRRLAEPGETPSRAALRGLEKIAPGAPK